MSGPMAINVRAEIVSACEGWKRDATGEPASLIAALARNVQQHPRRVAARERDRGIWVEHDWAALLGDVLSIAAGFETLGVQCGHAVMVIGDNRLRLYEAMLAAMVLRAFPAPIYPDVPPAELVHYSQLGRPDIAVAEDQEQVDKLLELRERNEGRPHTIVYHDPRGLVRYSQPGLLSLDQLIERGREQLRREPALVMDLIGRAELGDVAVLMHSSGTTGAPKGIPLSHANLLGGARNAAAAGYFRHHEEHYAYLPMAWVGDFVFTLAAGLSLAFTINIPERQETVLHDLREVAPTMYLAAPRAWDHMLTRLQVGIAESTPLKRGLYDWFMRRAVEVERRRLDGRSPTAYERLLRQLGEWLVFAPVRDILGLSRARRAYTGGEALGEDTFLAFRALGINLKQFYGQTETAALTAAQDDGDIKLHTVGKPMPNVDVRIDERGEIQVRSVSVFAGYYDNPSATAEALHDGWLATGDAGYLEPDGHLVVLGRVSEVVHTAAGERYVPNYIENRLKFSPYVRNAAVIGAGRDRLSALVCIDFEAVGHWAEEHGLPYTSYAELSQLPQVVELIASVMRHVNRVLKPELRLSRFVNLPKDFDADDGEITRTRKLRRNVVEQRYATLIVALYGPASSVDFDAAITYESGQTGSLRRTLQLRSID
jgi:long-chain acyl-CoA synthetase